jgi:Kef-type K+ transport system membrane component KefB
VRGVARFKRPKTLLITSLGLCFAFAMIAERLGYTVVLGAFLAGSLVAESEQGAVVEKLIEPVRHIFGAIFFVGVGMLIEPQLLIRNWPALVVLTVVAIVGKTVFVSLASMLIGERPYRCQNRICNGTGRHVLNSFRAGCGRRCHGRFALLLGSGAQSSDFHHASNTNPGVQPSSGLDRPPSPGTRSENAFAV